MRQPCSICAIHGPDTAAQGGESAPWAHVRCVLRRHAGDSRDGLGDSALAGVIELRAPAALPLPGLCAWPRTPRLTLGVLPLRVHLGWTGLTRGALGRLGTGDVLRGRPEPFCRDIRLICGPGHALGLDLVEGQLVCREGLKDMRQLRPIGTAAQAKGLTTEATGSSSGSSSGSLAGSLSGGVVTVDIDLTLPALRLSWEEAIALQPGQVLVPHTKAGALSVTIRVQDKPVALGELVEIGVQITAMLPDD
ncbi:MAG: FliM/FliN family flagellar motor switch protein [Roseinatronobacter sp.]